MLIYETEDFTRENFEDSLFIKLSQTSPFF